MANYFLTSPTAAAVSPLLFLSSSSVVFGSPTPTEDVAEVTSSSSSSVQTRTEGQQRQLQEPPVVSQAWRSSFDEKDEDFIRRCIVELTNITLDVFNSTENPEPACREISDFKNSSNVVLEERMMVIIVIVYRYLIHGSTRIRSKSLECISLILFSSSTFFEDVREKSMEHMLGPNKGHVYL